MGVTITFVITAIHSAVTACGGPSALARLLGVTQSAPSMWLARGRVPGDKCPAIERAMHGRVTCEELRPDIRWTRVADPSWPHPAGRPCIDPAAPAPAPPVKSSPKRARRQGVAA